MSTKLQLTTPIEAHGETLSELTFRELTTEDIQRCGTPFSFSTQKGSDKLIISQDTQVAGKYIIRLAGIPESSVLKMTPKDFMRAVTVVMDFFGEAMDAGL